MRDLGECTSGELAGTAPTLVVPVGSIEQHGPHLPLDTDTRIAMAVADGVARSLDYLMAPPITYGASGEHQGFSGTVSIGTLVLTAVLVEYGRSACEWASGVIFINGHGGNVEALRSATTTLRGEGRDAAWVSCSAAGSDAHAGHTETSLLLHLSPELVDTDDWVPGNTAPLSELMPALRRGGVAAVSASGILGDPTTGSAEAGSRIFADMLADCLRRIRRWAPGPDGMLA